MTFLLLPFWGQCFLAVVGAIASYVIWAQTYWARRGVPHTRPVPVLGNLWDTIRGRRSAAEILGEMYRRFDKYPVVGTYNLMRPVLLLRDPALVKQVLITNFSSFPVNEVVYPAGKDELLSKNPFAADATRWKDMRLKMAQSFSPARVKLGFEDVRSSARALAALIASESGNSSMEASLLARRYTAHTSTRALFGIESHSLEIGQAPGVFYEKGHEIWNGNFISYFRILAFFNCPDLLPLVGYKMVNSDTVGFFRKLVVDSVEFRQKEGITRDDLVQNSAMLILKDGKIDEAALDTVTGKALTTFSETFETSAMATASALLHLAISPQHQDRLREELRGAFPDGNVEHDKLMELRYLDQVLKEVLRILPPVEVIRRRCEKTTTLQPEEGDAVTVEAGTAVYVDIVALHHDPAYFSHPEEFWPDHFSDEECESRPKCVYLPFGDGPRQCVGIRYAMQLVKVAVATLVLHFRLTPGPEQVLPVQRDPASLVLGIKGGIWLRFEPLDSQA